VTLGSFGFAHPALLLLLPLAAVPFWGFSAPPSPYPSVAALPQDWLSDWIGRGMRALASLSIASTVIALAAPYRAEKPIEQFAPGAEIVLLLDRSRSMDQSFAGDPHASWFAARAETKASVAQRLLSQFAAHRGHDRLGMVVFSTLPIPIIDLTRNGDLAQAAIRASALGRGLAGTDLGRGLLEALSYFEGRPYTGSRVILLVSDGGAELDADTQAHIARLMKRDHVALDWLYLRSFRSPGLGGRAASTAGTADTAPERALHEFFRSMGTPYRLYEAQDPHAVQHAIEDVSRLEDLPIRYTEVLPPNDYSRVAYWTALLLTLVLLAVKTLELERWS
jgi:mxaC protein